MNTLEFGQLGSAIVAAITAAFAYLAIKTHRKTSSGSTMLDCLGKHSEIMEHRMRAEENEDVFLAEQYYRENFDLLWSEIYLWINGLIEDRPMRDWLYYRYKDYIANDKIKVNLDGETKYVTYREQWDACVKKGYFRSDDPFIPFMEMVHHGKINNMKVLKRYLKKDMEKREKQSDFY